MTNEEAIKTLDIMWKMLTSAYDEIADSFVLAYSIAVDSLKAQIDKDTNVPSNGDTIYRQAAIDELYKMLHDCFWTDDEELDAIITTLNDLPSAQLEPLKITIDPPTADEMERLEQAIRNTPVMLLPSAQPEEDCDTCKHGYFCDDKCNNCRVRYPSHYERRTDESD